MPNYPRNPARNAFARLLLTLLAIGSFTAFGNDLQTANALYDQGKFAEAKQQYQQLLNNGPWSANLFYNLANAEFRLDDLGAAALNYERALALEPSHREAAKNLQFVREKSGAIIPEKSIYEKVASFPLRLVPPGALIITATILAWLSLFSAVALYRCAPQSRSLLRWLCVSCALLAACSATPLWLHDQSLAIVTAKQTDARLAPADRAALAQTLPGGSRVRIRSERGDWIYCELPSKELGWIPANSLQKVALERRQ